MKTPTRHRVKEIIHREENLDDRIILNLTETEEYSHIQDIFHPKVYTKQIGNTSTTPVYKIFMKDLKIEEVPYPRNKDINPEEYFKKKLNDKHNLEIFPAIGPIKPLKTWKDFENLQEPKIEIKLETGSQHSYHKRHMIRKY